MPIRITGMNSGLDTESIISELVKAKSVKKDELVKAQTKLEWKQEAWKELNSKVYSLYSKTLSNMRFETDYLKKTTKVSTSAASVITGSKAVNGVQTLKIDKLAKTGYLTGAKLSKDVKGNAISGTTKLTDLGIVQTDGSIKEGSQIKAGEELELTINGKTTTISIDGDMTVDSFTKKLSEAGLNASFDAKNQRFFISAKESGKAADFALTAKTAGGLNALNALGLATSLKTDEAAKNAYLEYCNEIEVKDAEGKVIGYSYEVKSAEQLKSMVDAEVQKRLEKYISNQNELTSVKEQITTAEDEYKDKYTQEHTDTTTKTLKEELEAKKKEADKAQGDDKEALNNEITALEEKISASENLDTLKAKKAELETAIKAEDDKGYFKADADAEGGYSLNADADNTLEEVVAADITEKAEFAASVLNSSDSSATAKATRIAGQDAKIILNGAEFESTTNTFEINGLTITANAETEEEITITTSDDTEGIYDMIKGFLKEYNELINEMDKLYNADSSKGYEPLTDEEKEAMSEKEVEKWEEKIKNSILRRDSTLSSVASAMKQIMAEGIDLGDGKNIYLSEFGIGTLGYFSSADNEKSAYHIDGDPDDTSTSGNPDKLKTAIANDPGKVVDFFTALSKKLYGKLGDMMKKTEYSSSFTLYDDIAMKTEYNDYKTKISQQEKRITDFEDRYYKKFSAMETALAKLTSKESAISGLLGM